MIKKAKVCDARLAFIVTAFNKLLADENFLHAVAGGSTGHDAKISFGQTLTQTKASSMSEMKIGFEMRKIRLPLENILPMRQIKAEEKDTYRYKTILASIKEVGLVEPLVVYPQKDAPGKYMLKNGHLRYFALKELGKPKPTASSPPTTNATPTMRASAGCRRFRNTK